MRTKSKIRGIIVVGSIVGFAALGVYYRLFLGGDSVYIHFAYLPAILASSWWGRRGLWVAALLAILIVALTLLSNIGTNWVDNGVRVGVLLIASALTAGLRERLARIYLEVENSEENYRLLFEKSLCGIVVYRNDIIILANARCGELLGIDPRELAGKPIWDIFHESERERIQDLAATRRTHGVIDLHYEARINRKSGKPCWVVVASSATEFDGLPAVIVHAVDITESKEALKTRDELSEIAQVQEEQLVHSTRLAELGEMAAQVAHELNQPLTGIRNFASNALYMLENEIGEPIEVTDNLKRIAEQVDRAARIINRMRQLARKTERQLGQIDINALISEMVEFLTPQLNLSGVTVTLDLMQGLPPLMGDRIRLEQVLLNLLTNARQAMEESHERRLAIRTFVNSSQLCPLTIEVRDTGIGFGPGVAEKLFRPFFTTKKPGQGTGLGLSISLSIIKDHKGTIEAHSEPGRGTTFVVRLPLAMEIEGTKRAQEN